jgi:hypothetical protein
MKIWLNDKRVVRGNGYTFCSECALQLGHQCLAMYIPSGRPSLCLRGYKYETDV